MPFTIAYRVIGKTFGKIYFLVLAIMSFYIPIDMRELNGIKIKAALV